MSNNNTLSVTENMVYKGFIYYPDLQEEDDNCKTLHEVWTVVDGKPGKYAFNLNVSPYRTPSIEQFHSQVDGFIGG
jgi:hypothetical protein